MLPSTSSSTSSNTDGPPHAHTHAHAHAHAPLSTAASTGIQSGFLGLHPASSAASTTAPEVGARAGAGPPPPPNAPSLSLNPNPNPNPYKRGLSSSLDGDVQSPDSATSQPGDRDNVSTITQDQRTKKRRAGPGSRGVANLTPEQLVKKRANDREAQRAIRERTKNQIETLESRIRDLTSQQPYQELQKVIRQKEAVEAENAEIKARMASIVALIQPILSNHTAEGAYASPALTYAPMQPTQQQTHQQALSYSEHNILTPGGAASPPPGVEASWHGEAPSQSSSHSHQAKIPDQQRHDRVYNLHLGGGGEHLKLDFLLDPSQRLNRMQTGVNGAQDSPAYQHLPMKHDRTAPTHLNPRNNTTASGTPPPPPQQQQHQQHQQHQHQHIEYAVSPLNPAQPLWIPVNSSIKHMEPTGTLDTVLLGFLHERRQRAAEGVSPQEIEGPKYPSISSLLNPANSKYSHPLSKVFTDILSTFPAICRLQEKIAVLYVMFMVMRWQINPTKENYQLIPSFLHPLPAQFNVQHPLWTDFLPFPAMREKIVLNYNPIEYLFEDIFVPYTLTLSLNWPYEDTDTLLESPDGSEIIINPVFERHLYKGENWTLGPAFDKAFPHLRGTYNLKSDDSLSNQNGT
ncbi:hypothetical protein HD806DRAFT_483423 [Xylariaceae sp. AK1471]|nr:hypothetical protein HD806DRAFT_483423 [Xylariaceae sp. AK1471]